MRLKEIEEISGRILLKSGLQIGAGDMEMRIGGTDKPIVKHPHTQKPYIPGSSLKGKVRSLLEIRSGLIGIRGKKGDPLGLKDLRKLQNIHEKDPQELKSKNWDIDECRNILKLFGVSGAESHEDSGLGPTRVSFADCPISAKWEEEVGAVEQGLAYVEVKSENAINRITGTAKSPRFFERVPEGVEFDFSISLKVFEDENGVVDDLAPLLLDGLKLLEMDSLGGSGSRGYGRVAFKFDTKEWNDKFDELQPFKTE